MGWWGSPCSFSLAKAALILIPSSCPYALALDLPILLPLILNRHSLPSLLYSLHPLFFHKFILFCFILFFKLYLPIFRKRRMEGEREEEKHQFKRETWFVSSQGARPNWDGLTTQACALTGNWTSNLSLCGTMPNPLSHISQGQFILFQRSHVCGCPISSPSLDP